MKLVVGEELSRAGTVGPLININAYRQ